MKIAVSNDNGVVSLHFGRCAAYTIAEIEGGRILSTEEIGNPGHQPGFLPQFLSELGVDCIICGGMGQRAQLLFRQGGIETIVGAVGSVEEVIRRFADGDLEQGKSLCERGGEGNHHHGECRHGSESRWKNDRGGNDAQA